MHTLYLNFTLKSIRRRAKTFRFHSCICCMSIVALCAMAIIYSVIQLFQYNSAQKKYGSWNIAVYQTNEKTINDLNQNALISKIGTMSIYARLETTSPLTTNYLGYVDEDTRSQISLHFEKGHYPTKPTEIALSKKLLFELGVEDTLGSMVTLNYGTADDRIHEQCFILSGIINTKPNSYLEQGPLVTAFVARDFSQLTKNILFYNAFITTQEEYTGEELMQELKTSFSNTQSTSSETWYFNSYLKVPNSFSDNIIFSMCIIACVFIAIIYHNYLRYFSSRLKTLSNLKIIALSQQKCLTILKQETLTLTIVYIVISGAIVSIAIGIFVSIVYIIAPELIVAISPKLIAISFLIGCVALIFSSFAPLLHTTIITKSPTKPALPKPYTTKTTSNKFSKYFYIKRFCQVYRVNIYTLVVIKVCSILTILVFSIYSYYLFTEYFELEHSYSCDYMAGISPYEVSDNSERQENLIPFESLHQIQRLDNISDIVALRYTIIDSIPIIEINTKSNLVELAATENILPKKAKTLPFCIVYLPDNYDYKNNTRLLNNDLQIGDDLLFSYNNIKSKITISNIIKTDTFALEYQMENISTPVIYCSSPYYEKITNSKADDNYNYVSIFYSKEADPTATTNIIDSLLYPKVSNTIVHTRQKKDTECSFLIMQFGKLLSITLFILIIIKTLLNNFSTNLLNHLSSTLKTLWYLGLKKRSMTVLFGKLELFSDIICFIITLPIYFIFHRCILHLYSSSAIHQSVHIEVTPYLFLYCLAIMLFIAAIYTYIQMLNVKKILNTF